MTEWTWMNLGGGALALGHRPRVKAFDQLAAEGATHVVTLLSEHEGALAIEASVCESGLVWIWLPLVSGNPADADEGEVRRSLKAMRTALLGGGRLFLHCSAGIHRTGMITYALLRSMGFVRDDALGVLGQLRAVTAAGVGAKRLAWADRFATGDPRGGQ